MSKFFNKIINEWPALIPYLEKMEQCEQTHLIKIVLSVH